MGEEEFKSEGWFIEITTLSNEVKRCIIVLAGAIKGAGVSFGKGKEEKQGRGR